MESPLSKQVSINLTPEKNSVAPILAIMTTIGVFLLFYIFTTVETKSAKEITFFILGAATNYLTTILTCYFGSSQSSSDKNKMIANQMQSPTSSESSRIETVG